MQGRSRAFANNASGQREVGSDRHDEQARPGLRHEGDRVEHDGADLIASARDGLDERTKIRAAARRQRAAHVFERDHIGRASLVPQRSDQAPERPERARALGVEPAARASERHVLAGKGGPGQLGAARQIARQKLANIGDLERRRAPVVRISPPLGGVEIIGDETAPARAEPGSGHAAAAEEFIEAEVRHACSRIAPPSAM